MNTSTNNSMKMNAANNSANNSSNNSSNNSGMTGGKRRTRKNRNNVMEGGSLVTVGSKAQVYHGNAKRTSGGLTKKDLMKTKKGRIVSRRKHAAGKKALKNLRKAGFVAKKGTFKLFKK
jgi:hypothetical protein